MPMDFPGRVHVSIQAPSITMALPTSSLRVIPVAGPKGDKGDTGDSSEVLSYRHTQSEPATLVQVVHGLPYRPAGIICTETDGYQLDYHTVSHPVDGVTEVTFGVGFVGTIDLS